MTTTQPLDIFQVLNNVSKKNINYYSSLSEEQQKALQPFVVLRWLTGTRDARQVYFLNELVNPFVFSMPNHKQLLYFLLTTATSGKQQRYTWAKSLTKKTSSTPIILGVVKSYFKYNTTDAVEAMVLLTNEDILSCAEQLGYQPDEITKIKKELKNRHGNT